jgi:hypothetical protein
MRLGKAARAQAVQRWDRRLLAARFCAVVERAAASGGAPLRDPLTVAV